MKFKFLKCAIFFFAMIASINSYAWNALGHMIVAQIAYDKLQPEVRTKVDKMVADLAKEYPEQTSFARTASWADELRSQRIETYTHWHYIDIAFSGDATHVKHLADQDNIVWALNKIKPVIANPKANPFERARFLAFFTHMMGDIHQPLHNVSRITAAHPDGDQGGNAYLIQYPASDAGGITNLHHLWDNGLQMFDVKPTQENVEYLSRKIASQYPEKYFGAKLDDATADNWVNEGFEIAKEFVYSTPENQAPGTAYLENGKQIVEQRVALAGYRLASALNKLLGTN